MPLTVAEAREQRVCRICEKPIPEKGYPKGWQFDFGEMVFPVKFTLNYGKEFAHTSCLETILNNPVPL